MKLFDAWAVLPYVPRLMNPPLGAGSAAKGEAGSPRSTAGERTASSSDDSARGIPAGPVVPLKIGARLPPWKLPAVLCSWKSSSVPWSARLANPSNAVRAADIHEPRIERDAVGVIAAGEAPILQSRAGDVFPRANLAGPGRIQIVVIAGEPDFRVRR